MKQTFIKLLTLHIKVLLGLPWWSSGEETTCDARYIGSIPGSGNIPHAVGNQARNPQLRAHVQHPLKPSHSEPVLCNGRNPCIIHSRYFSFSRGLLQRFSSPSAACPFVLLTTSFKEQLQTPIKWHNQRAAPFAAPGEEPTGNSEDLAQPVTDK